MPTIKKTVGQITLKVLTDVESTTYYYLLQSSMAPAPSAPTTNPPGSGWSTTEPEFFSYIPTQDTVVISGKDYYTRSGSAGSYTYTIVSNPTGNPSTNSYYEKIYGDTRSLYVTVQTLYTDGTYDYTTPSLSSSYEAAKEAYNRAQSALTIAGDINQYFWSLTSQYSTSVPAGVYVTSIPQNQFKPSPAQGNILMQSTGLTIRNGAVELASLTGSALNFYKPGVGSQAPSIQLSNSALTIYNPNSNARTLMLDSSGLNFYGSNTSTADVTLDSDGLTLLNGSIKSGPFITPEQDGFLYLSPQVYTGIISGHSAGQIPIDNYVKNNWRQIIGRKFAVDTDGNLYANNANIEGAITATSLTIGSGSDAYDGAAAINISGYDIEIEKNGIDEVEGVSVYLYPILYHNGVQVPTIEVDYSHFIWYQDDDTIGTEGDGENSGRYLATYGHNYRVIYDFDDGAVGGGTEVVDRTIDPSKYITKISDTGITIHPEVWANQSSYIQLDGAGMELFNSNGNSIAQYGSTARVGLNNSSRFLMNSNSLEAYDNNNIKYFEVTSSGLSWGSNTAATTDDLEDAAKTATNYISIVDNNGITIHSNNDNNERNILINSNEISIRNGLLPIMTLDNDSLDFNVIDTTMGTYTNVASFGASSTIGVIDDTYMNVNKSSITMVNKEIFEAFRLGFTDNSNADIDQIVTELPTIEYETKSVDLITPINYSLDAVEVAIYIKYGTNSSASIVNHYTADGTKTFSTGLVSLDIKWDVTINNNVIVITCISESTQPLNSLYMLITYKGESVDPSLCIGYGNSIVPKSTCIGSSNMVESPYGLAVGRNNYVSDNGTIGGAAIGTNNEATGNVAIAFGSNTKASGNISHAEGSGTEASGSVSHAEGYKTVAGGLYSHAQNLSTRAMSKWQTALGKYNIEDANDTYCVIIGNGTSSSPRSNALTVDWNGNTAIAGTLTQSSDRKLKDHISYLSADANEFIRSLKPAYFKKDDQFHVGFYAQDVEQSDKWHCMTGEMNGFKTLGYTEIIAPLVAYCQHLEERIKQLEEK